MSRLAQCFVLALIVPVASHAETVLIPVHLRPPAHWVTNVLVGNRTDQPVTAHGATFQVFCPIPEGCLRSELPPQSTAWLNSPSSVAGLLLNVPDATQVSISARIAVTPSGYTPAGAELPVVSESEFRTRPLHFMFVPVSMERFPARSHLRIYSLETQPVRVKVEMRGYYTVMGPPDEVREFTLEQRELPAPPNFLFVNLEAEFPWAATHTTVENVTVTPLPLPDGRIPAIWAFVTLTSQANEVSILRPS